MNIIIMLTHNLKCPGVYVCLWYKSDLLQETCISNELLRYWDSSQSVLKVSPIDVAPSLCIILMSIKTDVGQKEMAIVRLAVFSCDHYFPVWVGS